MIKVKLTPKSKKNLGQVLLFIWVSLAIYMYLRAEKTYYSPYADSPVVKMSKEGGL